MLGQCIYLARDYYPGVLHVLHWMDKLKNVYLLGNKTKTKMATHNTKDSIITYNRMHLFPSA